MLGCPAAQVFHLPKHKNITFSLHWNETEKKNGSITLRTLMIPWTFYSWETKHFACSHALHWRVALQFLQQWTLGTRVYSLQYNDREEAVFVCDTRSGCYGNHSYTHTHTCTHTNSVPTAWLAGSQTPTPTLTAFTFKTVWPDGGWIHNKYLCVFMCPRSCMHHLAVWRPPPDLPFDTRALK